MRLVALETHDADRCDVRVLAAEVLHEHRHGLLTVLLVSNIKAEIHDALERGLICGGVIDVRLESGQDVLQVVDAIHVDQVDGAQPAVRRVFRLQELQQAAHQRRSVLLDRGEIQEANRAVEGLGSNVRLKLRVQVGVEQVLGRFHAVRPRDGVQVVGADVPRLMVELHRLEEHGRSLRVPRLHQVLAHLVNVESVPQQVARALKSKLPQITDLAR